jgi:hypothetical protein
MMYSIKKNLKHSFIEKLSIYLLMRIYYLTFCWCISLKSLESMGRRGRDRMVVGFKTAYVISAYHH